MVYQLTATFQTGGAVQFDLNHSIHPLGLRSMGRGMPWLAAWGLRISFGLATRGGGRLSLAGPAGCLQLGQGFLERCFQRLHLLLQFGHLALQSGFLGAQLLILGAQLFVLGQKLLVGHATIIDLSAAKNLKTTGLV